MSQRMAESKVVPKQQQSLPDECLLVIIQQFKHNYLGLYNLLTVNRFFFQEALRLLMQAPFDHFYVSLLSGDKPKSYKRLLALFIQSLLIYQCLERKRRSQQQQTCHEVLGEKGNEDETDRRLVRNLAGSTTVQLCDTVTFSDISELLKEFGFKNKTKSSTPLFDESIGTYKKPTVDYSVYLGYIISWEPTEFSLCDALELYTYIDPVTNECKHIVLGEEASDAVDSAEFDWGVDDVHQEDSVVFLEKEDYIFKTKTRVFSQRIFRMLLHFNYDHIVQLEFFIHEAALFTPFATKLSQLRSLHLSRIYRTILNSRGILQVISFIQQNQRAFPSKPCLALVFHFTWNTSGEWRLYPRGMSRAAWLEFRQRCVKLTEPFIKMYKAIGRPRGMDVSDVPQFYLRSEGINVENLLQLCDKDSDRFTAGERVAMEDFLNRCHNLKTLELAVGSPYAFRWIASTLQAQSTPRPSSVQLMQRPMERLEKLSLWSNRGHTVLAYALSDAIAAFGKTLQELTCTDSSSYPVSYPYLDGADDFSELERLPSSMSVCVNWHLPRVRCIRISLGRAIQFGSFDECPLLEELSIFTTRQQLKTSDPYLNGDPLMDYQTLMPVWKLPRLRTLVLTGDIMVRFNYESLRSMKQLSDMAIHIQRSGSEFNFANIYSSLYSLPLQQAFESMKARIQTRNESAGDEDHVPVCCETSDFLPWNWKSDSLVKLSLHGPPVMALNLQLLEQLPSLREVSLAVPNNCQYTFSASETEAMARVFSMQRLGNLQVEPLDHLLQEQWKLFARPLKRSISDQYVKPSLSMFMRNSKRQGIAGLWDHSIQPFVQSRLQEFSISSPLVHDVPETLVQLLAWSAPNLKTLRLDSQSVFDAKAEETIVMLLKAIPTADKIIKFRATQETAKVRSQGSGGVLTTLDSSTQEGGSRKGQVPRQELGISDNTSKPKGHPVYSKSGLKSFLIKVLVHVGLSQKSLRELGLRLIKSHEVKIYQGQGVRLYRLQGRDYVEEGDLQIL